MFGTKDAEYGQQHRNAIDMLLQDHRTVRGVFEQFQATSDRSTQKQLVNQMLELLKLHTQVEEQIFYAEAAKLVPEMEADLIKAQEAHHVADLLMKELSAKWIKDEHYVAKAKVLIDSVMTHMMEEENLLLPKVRQMVSEDKLTDMGARMAAMKGKQ